MQVGVVIHNLFIKTIEVLRACVSECFVKNNISVFAISDTNFTGQIVHICHLSFT